MAKWQHQMFLDWVKGRLYVGCSCGWRSKEAFDGEDREQKAREAYVVHTRLIEQAPRMKEEW